MDEKTSLTITVYSLYQDIKELSDISYQKKLWLLEIPDYISSYDELYARIFYDSDIDTFINDLMPRLNVSYEFVCEFVKMRNLLFAYDEGYRKTYGERGAREDVIFNDLKWHEISDQAKIVLDYWNKELGIPEQPE